MDQAYIESYNAEMVNQSLIMGLPIDHHISDD